jgi:hypothetical protein
LSCTSIAKVVDFNLLGGVPLQELLQAGSDCVVVPDPIAESGRAAKNKDIAITTVERPRTIVLRAAEAIFVDVHPFPRLRTFLELGG